MAKNLLNKLLWSIFAYIPTLTFLGLKWGIIKRDGDIYNWQGVEAHTLWFLLIFAIDSIKFVMIMSRKER